MREDPELENMDLVLSSFENVEEFRFTASPGPVDVVVHVIRVESEAGHVVDHHLDGVIGPGLDVTQGVQLGLKELGDVEED